MNEALHVAKESASANEVLTPSFSVQSEKEIWWLGAFKVPKETHEVLAWVFQRIPCVTEVIKSQIAGEQLMVEGQVSFAVDWHLGGDLKTIKCMLGCTPGANTHFPCPFCMRGYKKIIKQKGKKRSSNCVEEDEQEIQDADIEDGEWDGGILKCPMLQEPDRSIKDKNWHPIIPFSLNNVHFCTLHAFMRIFDRLLKLHIDYAFTMPDDRGKEALHNVEGLLNLLGCHGGNVTIVANKKNGDNHEVAQQVSMSGVKARRFLAKPVRSRQSFEAALENGNDCNSKSWELWKDLCRFTTDNEVDPIINRRKEVWACFNKVLHLMSQNHNYRAAITV